MSPLQGKWAKGLSRARVGSKRRKPYYQAQVPNQWAWFEGFPTDKGFSLEAFELLGGINEIDPVVVLSLSYGSFPATAFAQKYPKNVQSPVYVMGP